MKQVNYVPGVIPWCLLTILLLGSMESDFDGKTQNQPHSFPAFGYFLSRAPGSQTPLISSLLSLS